MQVHFLSREMIYMALVLLKRFEVGTVDSLMVMMSKVVYGDLSKYGIRRPSEGPFYMKSMYGKYPVIDVGAYEKIKAGEIQVRVLSSTYLGRQLNHNFTVKFGDHVGG
jgi:indole-3-pyruvate monooxygenase